MADDFETPWNGNEFLPFADMIAVEQVDKWTFKSIAKPFAPGGGTGAFGGHVYAQSVYAASKTLNPDDGRVVCVCMLFLRTRVLSKFHLSQILRRKSLDGRNCCFKENYMFD